MALADLFAMLFGPRIRMPRDQTTRVRRAARKAAKAEIDGMQAALDKISAMPGIADVKQTKRVPRGFDEAMNDLRRDYDSYFNTVRNFLPQADTAKQPGEPGGTGACYAAPMPVMGVEALAIYRTIRPWKDFQRVAQRMAELGEHQFSEIQAGHKGKDPERIRMGGKTVQQGRIAFAKRMQACPFLDEGKQRCRIWEQRPICCRMHLPLVDEATTRPDHEGYPKAVKAHNVRLPVQQQVVVRQLEKRLALELNPFLYASLLQLTQLADGQPILEVGEVPRKLQQDGQVVQRANRNVRHAAKFNKGKKSKKTKKKKKKK